MALQEYESIIYRCFRCGYCKLPSDYGDYNCPIYARFRLETCFPGGILWLMRAWWKNEIRWTDRLAKILFSCTTCSNCVEECVMSFKTDILNMITAGKSDMVEMGSVPAKVKGFLENITRYGNPYGESREKRDMWLEGTDIEQYKGQEYLYYVGCVGSYDTRAKEVTKSLGKLLLKSGLDFGVLGKEENCDGNEVRGLGEESLFEAMADDNIKQFRDSGVKKIVTLSPHSYNAMHKYYSQPDGDFEVLHYTQVVKSLIYDKKLDVTKGLTAKVTYHDPCFLGRWNTEYEAPREILGAIPGIELVEMERNKSNAFCCGGGGGNFYIDSFGSSEYVPARIRVREALSTGADILAVACPICLTMLDDAVKVEGIEDRLKVMDISEIVASVCLQEG
ncbi:(Fe-S)-binding protein [Chloroflexota bacterium]